jgi:protein TonB
LLPVFALEHVVPLPVFPTTTASLSIDLSRPSAEPFGDVVRLGLAGPRPGRDSLPRTGRTYTSDLVEKVVTPRAGNPAPAYPASLRSAQVEGSVLARFVVDTTGRVEVASINFPEATHALFADAVRQSLLRSRYLPAVLDDHAVRQLVEQRFAFTLTR